MRWLQSIVVSYRAGIEDNNGKITASIETTNLNIKLQFNASRGFFLTLPVDQLKGGEGDLPSIFINVIKKKKLYSFATIELVMYIGTGRYQMASLLIATFKLQKNSRMNESLAEIYLMSDK